MHFSTQLSELQLQQFVCISKENFVDFEWNMQKKISIVLS